MISIYLALLFITGAFTGGIFVGALLVVRIKAQHDFIEKNYPVVDHDLSDLYTDDEELWHPKVK